MRGEAGTSSAATRHLAVSNLAAGYGGALIIEHITLSVASGQVVSIIGPNGSGKSTLVKTIAGVLRAARGEVTLGEEEVTNFRGEQLARRGLGYVPQSRDVFTGLTAKENLEMGGYLLPQREVPGRIDEMIALFPPLSRLLGREVGKLSGGERKMVAIARVLMLQPTVLVLDEPTAGLSPELAHTVLTEYIRRIADEGAAVLLVEQRAVQALEMADFGHVLVGGRMQVSASARELLEREDIGEMFLGRVPSDEDERSDHALALGAVAHSGVADEDVPSVQRGPT